MNEREKEIAKFERELLEKDEERHKALYELKKVLLEEYLLLWRWIKKRPWIPILYMGTLWVLATLEILNII